MQTPDPHPPTPFPLKGEGGFWARGATRPSDLWDIFPGNTGRIAYVSMVAA